MSVSTYKELNVDEIQLDIENPRIKLFLEQQFEKVDAAGIALALSGGASDGGDSSFDALVESIKINGGIINPIIVNHKKDGKYIVIEGNTRLQIYKDFKLNKVAGNWDIIRSIVYEDLPDEQIHSIRLQAHMVGPRDWDPYSKAKYLNYLQNTALWPMSKIITFCGNKSSEITRLIKAYNTIQTTFIPMLKEVGDDFSPKDFSKFSELQNKGIIKALLENQYTEKDFCKWVIDGNIDVALKIRELPSILNCKEAKEEFLRTNLSNAVKKLGASSPHSNIDYNNVNYIDLARELTKKLDRIELKEQKYLMSDEGTEKRNALYTLKDTINFVIGEDEEDN